MESKFKRVSDWFDWFACRLFSRPAEKFLQKTGFEKQLKRGEVLLSPTTFIANAFLSALFSIPISIIGLLGGLFLSPILFVVVPAPAYAFLIHLAYPFLKASERASKLDPELPFMATYISVMAAGGFKPEKSFKRLTEIDLLPATKSEATKIIYNIEVKGDEPLQALKKIVEDNPNKKFVDFIQGYVDNEITGGDPQHYLRVVTDTLLRERIEKVKAKVGELMTLLTIYVTAIVMVTLTFYLMWALAWTGIGTPFPIEFIYLMNVFLSSIVILMAHAVQYKTPVKNVGPYKILAMTLPIGTLVGFILHNFIPFNLAFLIASIIIFTLPAINELRTARFMSSVDAGVVNFLRDYVEARKTGLPPERCVSDLADRKYGEFNKILTRMVWLIKQGKPFRDAFESAVSTTKSWTTRLFLFLLVETIDVGGASVEVSEALAHFALTNKEVEKAKGSEIKPLVFIPYFLVVLTLTTVVMIVKMLLGFGGMPGAQAISPTATMNILTFTLLFQCVCAGFVAGKVGEGNLAAGFKHVVLMLIITYVGAMIMGAIA
jgi:flagellar protein FlaJ